MRHLFAGASEGDRDRVPAADRIEPQSFALDV